MLGRILSLLRYSSLILCLVAFGGMVAVRLDLLPSVRPLVQFGVLAASFIVFGAMLIFAISIMRFAKIQPSRASNKFPSLFISIRGWIVGFVGAALFFTFTSLYGLHPGGLPERRDGHPVLTSHGRVIGQISEDEYVMAFGANAFQVFEFAFVCSWPALILFTFAPRAALMSSIENPTCSGSTYSGLNDA